MNDHPHTNTRRMADHMVRLACDLCQRKGQYRKETLIARFGGDVLMPDVRHLIAQCPRKDAPESACGVYYADLRDLLACFIASAGPCRSCQRQLRDVISRHGCGNLANLIIPGSWAIYASMARVRIYCPGIGTMPGDYNFRRMQR
jgi:hypothetical protein